MPLVTRPQITRVLRALLPQRVWEPDQLRAWLATTQQRLARAKRAHAKRHLIEYAKLSL